MKWLAATHHDTMLDAYSIQKESIFSALGNGIIWDSNAHFSTFPHLCVCLVLQYHTRPSSCQIQRKAQVFIRDRAINLKKQKQTRNKKHNLQWWAMCFLHTHTQLRRWIRCTSCRLLLSPNPPASWLSSKCRALLVTRAKWKCKALPSSARGKKNMQIKWA